MLLICDVSYVPFSYISFYFLKNKHDFHKNASLHLKHPVYSFWKYCVWLNYNDERHFLGLKVWRFLGLTVWDFLKISFDRYFVKL